MTEDILYENPPFRITPARVVVGGTTYAVANITSVKAVRDVTLRRIGIGCVVFGILLLATVWPIGLLLIIVGIPLIIFGSRFDVMLTTGAAEQQAFRSRHKKLVLEVASAINLAIMKRSQYPR